jgi:hypothetical protein
MKRLLLPALLLFSPFASAALVLDNTQTTGVQTFSATPPVADWSTASISGAAGTLSTIAQVDAAAQARTAASVSTVLGTQAGNGTNGLAQRNSTANFIYTAATGNNATLLMATLQNSSGAAVSAISIGYDHTRIGTAVEESMGHRVFYSLTGAANSWTLIPALSNIGTNQALSTTVSLTSAWANGATMYLLWIDDNGSGTDTPFTIDNFVVAAADPPPTVSLNSPVAGASSFSPGSFSLAASASDNGSITQVEFLRGGSVIHTDTSAPYSFTDTGLAVGGYSYTARATDNLGATTTSAAVSVSVNLDPNNLPANTALWFDGVNDYVTMGTALDLGVGGPPTNGMTLECWFRRDGAGATSSSGSGGVTAVPLFGKGRSEGDGSTIDCNYFFGINTAGILVADFETYPATGLTSGQNYPITATNSPITNGVWNHAAVTYDGTSATWKIYLNGVEVGTATAAAGALPRYDSIQHFGIGTAMTSTGVREGAFHGIIDEVRVWNYARSAMEINATKDVAVTSSTGLVGRYGLNEGTGTSTASSTATSSGTLTNGPLWIEGAPLVVNDPPTASITAPANNASFNAPAAFTISADAADPDGTVTKVEFFQGATKIAEDTTAPYSHDVTGLAEGTYSYTVRATDNFGAFTNSAAVNVNVGPPLTDPPTVSITTPLDGASFLAPASITINANAADTDGTVTKVEFFNGATKLGEDTSAPYSFVWNNVTVGNYTLTAKATDNMTATATSAAVAISVVVNQAPTITLTSPADAATNVGTGGTVSLSASVSDPESQPLTVTFYGRPKSAPVGPDFTLATLPDTQFYSENSGGTRLQHFTSQTNWLVANRTALNIPFVAHMGDMVNTASVAQEWTNANTAMSIIEDPVTTTLAHGIPWGGAPGNHDGTGTEWDTHFGLSRFAGRTYFQGGYNSSNRNNYQFFSASGLDFIIINLAYNSNTAGNQAIMDWADALLKAHPTRRGIVTSHWLIGTGNPAAWGGHGQAVYNNLRDNPNLFLMLCGHIHGEGQRSDVFEGRTVYTVLQDYQSRANGGDSWLRYFIFSPANNTITAKTIQTRTGNYETDTDSEFVLPYTMGAGTASWTALGTVNATSGTASLDWTGLAGNTEYEWYAAVSDGTNNVGSTTRGFTAAANASPTVSLTSPAEGATIALPSQVLFAATAADTDGSVAKVEFFAGATKVGEDTSAPFSFAWTSISGAYALTAVATDNQGASTTSAAVNITVTNPANMPPTVAISSPIDGFSTENSTLTIAANAADTDGIISKVEFFQGSTKLGEDSTAPYSYNWTGVSVGSYALTAKATDNDGGITTSDVVNVTFTPPGNFTGSLTQNFDSMGTTGTTPPGTWTVWNAASGTTNSTWTSSVAASGLPSMTQVANPLTAITTPSANNLNGYNAAASAGNVSNRVLASAPTTVAGMAFQLLLTNGSGLPIQEMQISYDTLRFTAASSANELPGYWLFYSLDNGVTWLNVPALNGTITSVPNTIGTTNHAASNIVLASTWQADSQLLLRWVDDNAAATSPDQIVGLDNVQITASPLRPTVVLASPADNAMTKSPVDVSFSIADLAPSGSLKLSFGTRTLELASSLAAIGSHSFSFDPANPTTEPGVASGSAIPDGTYDVSLSYLSPTGQVFATDSNTNVLIDTTAPLITAPANINVVAPSSAGVVVNYTPATATDAGSGVQSVTHSQETGTLFTPGVNVVQVTATDALGNSSTTSFTITVTVSIPGTLVTLPISSSPAVGGSVMISPRLATGGKAAVGSTYTVTARPARGYFFSHWSGKPTGSTLSSSFTFADGDSVVANFVPTPFTTAIAGTYNGLITGADQASSGFISMRLTLGTGSLSARLVLNGIATPLRGVFHHATGLFTSPGVTLTLDFAQRTITGVVGASTVIAQKTYDRLQPPTTGVGIYNVAFTPPTSSSSLPPERYPHGNGYGVLTVSGLAGSSRLVGVLADGTAYSASSVICLNNTIPLYAAFRGGIGSLSGTVAVDTTAASTDVTGTGFKWFRNDPASQYYPLGYDTGLSMDLIGALQSTSTRTALGLSTAPQVTLSAGPFTSPVTKALIVGTSSLSSADKLTKLTISTKSLITGDHKSAIGAIKHSIKGIIVGKGGTACAYGHILSPLPITTDGTGQAGKLELAP